MVDKRNGKDFFFRYLFIAQCREEGPVFLSVMLYLGVLDLVCARYPKGRPVLHAAQFGRTLEGNQVIADGILVIALLLVSFTAAAGSEGVEDFFSFKCITSLAIGPTMFQHQVQP